MSSNYVFVVLAPNGRRQTVKVGPNTSILQVLEDVCQKQQLNSNEWDLKHFNRVVELANSVRFSGLANNATLEMVQSQRPRVENLVKLGLQLESGKRLMHQFSPAQTLWEVLLHWESQGETVFPVYSAEEELISTQPVCIYMRQEVVGKDKLQETTLRSLGLTHGSACIRLVHRSESQLRYQANVSAPLSRQSASVAQMPNESNNSASLASAQAELDSKLKGQSTNDNIDEDWTVPAQPAVQSQPERISVVASAEADVVASSAPVPMEQDEETLIEEKPLAQDLTTEVESYETEANRVKIAVDGQLHILGDHDAILYFADDVSRPTSKESLPDSFYDVTISDVKSMWRDLQVQRKILDDAPLQTASARSLEHDTEVLRNLHHHPVTFVRVRFSDRYVLQGKFRSVDTIAAVEHFVKQFLVNPELPFHLFTTPPKKILPSSSRLVEEDLVGNAVVYFGTEEKIDQFFKSDLYMLVSCPDAVQEYLRHNSEEGNPKPPLDPTSMSMTELPSTSHQQGSSGAASEPAASTSSPRQPPRSSLNPGSSSLQQGKVPKWFKTGK